MFRMFIVLVIAATTVGCATVSAADGHYAVSGVTATPNETIAVSSRARVNETYADAYAVAVRDGRAWPSMYGPQGEAAFYYGNVAPVQARPAAPRQSASCANCATLDDLGVVLNRADQAAATAVAAEDKADASIEAHRRLRAALTGSGQKKGKK